MAMASVKETCLCGALFEFSGPSAYVVTFAVEEFRKQHQACRIVANAERTNATTRTEPRTAAESTK